MFDDLKIRNKLVLLVAGPIVIIVLLAALGARSRQGTADDSRGVERLVAVARANSNVVDALQQESLYATAHVGSGREAWKSELAKVRKASDLALAGSLGRMEGGSRNTSASFRSASGLAVDAADKLRYIRQAVDQGYRWAQVATTYASVEQTFLAVNDTVSEALTDPLVAGQLRTGAALATYKAAIARQGSLLVGAGEEGGFAAEGSLALLQAAVDDEVSQQAIFTSISDIARKGDVRDALTSEARIDLEATRDQALAAGADTKVGVDPKALVAATGTVLGDLHQVETDLFDQVIGQSQAARSDAERAASLFLVAAVVAMLVAAAGAVLLGRRITRPLNKLTAAADHLASEQMPRLVESLRNPSDDELSFQLASLQAIEVSSNDEIGQLASSFNDVQRVAGEVAAEQAALLRKGIGEMFVNLARRNQALLDRQIEFIDELELGEEDPDQLENLYRLDHLATRMRRNAESLLVLAGAEPPRRRGRPAPLANVVRAALAEVEDFNRIQLLSFDEVLVASNVAADLAHLLSELMENATNFSPPETRVEVVGHHTKADGYVISVSDHGIGMSSDRILEANESLAKPPLVGLALSRSLGFIVVGRLSGRHGIAVRMMPSPAGGVTGVVSIPPGLVTDTPSMAHPEPIWEVPPAPGRRAPVLESPASSAPPPLEFRPYELASSAPASLAEAVPTGRAFDEGLDALSASGYPSPLFPTGPSVSPSTGERTNGLPTRRLSPTPVSAPRSTTVDPAAGSAPEPVPEHRSAPVSFAEAGADAAVDLPEALVFSEPDVVRSRPGPPASARVDGPPPAAPPLPTRAETPRPVAPAPEASPKPFFLEDAEPPRLFGRDNGTEAPPPAPPAELRPLFGGAPTPSLSAAPPAALPPLARRPAPVATSGTTTREPLAPPTPGPGGAAAEPVGEAARTTAGLTKRVPRQAGVSRAIPGADAERGVSATRRSPDEVRNLLSRYRDGQQRARAEESATADPSEERETHE